MIVTCGETAYSRKEAFETGKLYYFTGKPCSKGHLAIRRRSGVCLTCEKESDYDERHPEKARERGRRWDKKNKVKRQAQWAARRAPENIERTKAKARALYKKNRTKMLAATQKWKDANPEKAKAIVRRWNEKNPDRVRQNVRVNSLRRRARLRGLTEHATRVEIEGLRKKVGRKCAFCGKRRKLTIDHIEPLVRGGSNTIRNIQFYCKPCNSKKGGKDPIEFAQANGMLL